MKNIALSMLLLVTTGYALAKSDPEVQAAHQQAIRVAEKSAAQWLALLDSGKYEECWSSASPNFRKLISLERWLQVVTNVRPALGNPLTRSMIDSQYIQPPALRSDPDAIVFKTRVLFAGNNLAEESIILTLEKDGQWKIASSNIRGINFNVLDPKIR